jgi:uncharacterized protein YndB with AHSA1/START domain
MTIVSVDRDFDTLTLTVAADLAAPIERAWQLWADPRLLEQWWGPPTFPASVVEHDLTPGGMVTYVMNGPDGQRSRGWWRIVAVDAPRSLELVDGFADADGNPSPDLPTTTIRVELSEHQGGTRMVMRSVFESLDHMQQVLDIGAAEVLQQAIGQIDALLAA